MKIVDIVKHVFDPKSEVIFFSEVRELKSSGYFI